MTPVSVCAWKWGTRFDALHVNVLRAAVDRRLPMAEFVCVTDDPSGLDGDIRVVPMPERFSDTPRCQRRMQQYDRDFAAALGSRVLYLDLDVVILDDLTPIVNRPEPIVGWKVGHAGVYSGSFLLADAGALDGAWRLFAADPEGYPSSLQPRGVASDQAMVNDWLSRQPAIPFWTEADGFVSYYGVGYERLEHLGVGPNRPALPAGARIVVLGSADLHVLQEGRFSWVQEHWTPLADACRRRAA